MGYCPLLARCMRRHTCSPRGVEAARMGYCPLLARCMRRHTCSPRGVEAAPHGVLFTACFLPAAPACCRRRVPVSVVRRAIAGRCTL